MRDFEVAYFAASIDDPEANRRFAEELDLDFPVLCDPGKEVARSYGVLRAFGLYTARQTIYIDREGRVAEIDRDVTPASAGEDMVRRLEALGVPRRSPSS